MKIALFLFVYLHFLVPLAKANLSLATAIGELPPCALTCLSTAIDNSTCSATDVNCVCGNTQLNYQSQACVEATCTVREALSTKNITTSLCNAQAPANYEIKPILGIFVGLAALAAFLRLVARYLTACYFWWDDLFNLFAMGGCIAFAATNFKVVDLGMGKDIWQVPFDNISVILQIFWINMILYCFTRGFIRASIIFFYLRVFPSTSSPTTARLIIWTGVANLLHILAFTLAVILQCQPIQYFWLRWDHGHAGRCGSANALAWSSSAVGIAFDIWLIALPFPTLWRLNLSWRKKAMAGVMLTVGLAFFVVSLVRLKTINIFTTTANPPRDFVEVGIWSGIEIDVGVVCTCLPATRQLLIHFGPRCMGLSSSAQASAPTPNASSVERNQALRRQKYLDIQKAFGETSTTCYSGSSVTTTMEAHSELELVGMKDPRSIGMRREVEVSRGNGDNVQGR